MQQNNVIAICKLQFTPHKVLYLFFTCSDPHWEHSNMEVFIKLCDAVNAMMSHNKDAINAMMAHIDVMNAMMFHKDVNAMMFHMEM